MDTLPAVPFTEQDTEQAIGQRALTIRQEAAAWKSGSYRLDNLLGHYDIPKPPDRHRAMPDVAVTAQTLARLPTDGCATGRWRTLLDLDMVAGLQPKRLTPTVPETGQRALF